MSPPVDMLIPTYGDPTAVLAPVPTRLHPTGARTTLYRVPREVWWPRPINDSTLVLESIDLVTFELDTKEGISGFGYTYVLGGGGPAVCALLHEISPQLLGQRVGRPEPIWHRLWTQMIRFGRGGLVSVALAALDVALWDALAKDVGLPLVQYIGSHREGLPVYGSSIDLGYTTAELVATVNDWTERGFGAVKIKVGRSIEEDLGRLSAVRDQIGPNIALMVDANNLWDIAEASRRLAAMSQFDLTWVEEPLMPDDIDGYRQLQTRFPTAIAAGETLFSVADFARYFRADAIQYVQADVARVGGITPWLHVAKLAEAHHLQMAPHFLQELHVHLACAVPNASVLEYLPLLDALIEAPLEVDDGIARPSDVPGHGIAFAVDVLAPFAVTTHECR